MRNYGQFCPIARGSEILAERWTPIILRNVLMGCHTFNQIAVGAPGLSRALLTRRLHKLENAGVIQIRPKPDGHGRCTGRRPPAGTCGRCCSPWAAGRSGGWTSRPSSGAAP
jgi:hypothetical protein